MNNNQELPEDILKGLEPLSRRRFLRASFIAGTAASAVVATGCTALQGSSSVKKKPAGIYHITDSEYEVMDKLVRVLLPTEQDPELPSSMNEVPTIKNIDTMLGKMEPQVKKLFSLGVRGFDYGAVGLSFRFRRFAHLTDKQAHDYVESWQGGSFVQRGLMTSLKSVVCLNYWRDERTWTALEYDGPVTEKWGIRRLGNAPLPRV